MRELLLIGLLVAVPPLLAAENGYRIDHPDGSVEYTDQPGADAKEVRLPELSTFPGESSSPSISQQQPTGTLKEEKDSATGRDDYTAFTISSPQNEETVWFNANGMVVTFQIEPGIAEGDEVAVKMDGETVASGSSTAYQIKDVFRGTHTLTAIIRDSQGTVLREAEPVVFYVRQHSILNQQKPQE